MKSKIKTKKRITNILFKKATSFIIFLAVLGIANIFIKLIPNFIFYKIINFLNINFVLICIIFLIEILSQLSWSTKFPFKLIAPLISAILSIFIINFVFSILQLISIIIEINPDFFLTKQATMITLYPVIFIAVLIIGYTIIFLEMSNPKNKN